MADLSLVWHSPFATLRHLQRPLTSSASCTGDCTPGTALAAPWLRSAGAGSLAPDDPVDLGGEDAVTSLHDVLIHHRRVRRRVAQPSLDLLDRPACERRQRAGQMPEVVKVEFRNAGCDA